MYRLLPRELPSQLQSLTELALDLRWTWTHAGDVLWRMLDEELWTKTQNPWAILQNVSTARLSTLSADPVFLGELEAYSENRLRYLQQAGWYSAADEAATKDKLKTVAYFSMEFGLGEVLPIYAGGLGVLAGDLLKTASDMAVPIVGVGLLYEEGYFRQLIDSDGRQRESYPHNDASVLPIQPATGPDGGWLRIQLRLPGRPLYLRVWEAVVGRVRLYLLDSNDFLNSVEDRGITAKLYPGNPELRLQQEIALGVGGWMALEKLGIDPEICHLNEGHPALAIVERTRSCMKKTGLSFWDAFWLTRAGNIFTTHTSLAAAFDLYPPQLVAKYSVHYLDEFKVPQRDLLALGRCNPADNGEPFNMAYLALRGCARTNAVSALHGEVSRKLFSALYPRWPIPEVPVTHITNGVHMPSWDSQSADRLWTNTCGKNRWQGGVEQLCEAMSAVPDESLWSLSAETRNRLVNYVRERLATQLGARGERRESIAHARKVLDPNVLTLGYARRFAKYKRPNLLLADPGRLARLLLNPERPVQLVIAGKAHPDDDYGKQLVQDWMRFIWRPGIRERVVFLSDYDMALAQQLVQGIDVWINTPLRTLEACGTSGMKVLVNGGLNVSILDGWWAEAWRPEVGWSINGQIDDRIPRSEQEDAEELYRLLEEEVIPMFYDRDSAGVPRPWVQRVRASLSTLTPRFSSNRMLEQYVRELYEPAVAEYRSRAADNGQLAHELRAWSARLAEGWHELHFGKAEVHAEDQEWRFRIPVYLGSIAPGDVVVELCTEASAGLPASVSKMEIESAIAGSTNGYLFTARVSASRPDWHYTARVRAFHPHAQVPSECGYLHWQH